MDNFQEVVQESSFGQVLDRMAFNSELDGAGRNLSES